MTTEDTIYDNPQVNKNNEVNNGNEEITNVDKVKKSDSTWRRAAVGAGAGILLGGVTSFFTSSAIANDEIPGKEEDSTTENSVEETPTTSTFVPEGNVQIAAGVNDDMSFAEAYSAARTEVGAGGAFQWHGNVYSTYSAEEWNNMSDAEKDTYYDNLKLNADSTQQSQTPITENEVKAETVETETNTETNNSDVEIVNVEPDNNIEQVEISQQEPEIEVLGVIHDEETGATVGGMTVDGQEVFLVDVGDGGNFEYMVSDIDHNGQLSENEIVDISNENIAISQFESNSMLANADDGMNDYINDSIDV